MTTTTILTAADAAVTSDDLSLDEQKLVSALRGNIGYFAKKNQVRTALYEGEFVADQIGIAVPPFLKDWPVKVGWGTTVVDVIGEKMNWQGFVSTSGKSGDLLGLDELADATFLDAKIDESVQKSLITGIGFLVVSRHGGKVKVRAISPSRIAVKTNFLTEQLEAALVQVRGDDGALLGETLYQPHQVISIEHELGRIKTVRRDRNPLGVVPVVPMPNQATDDHPNGRSLLTAPIVYSISAAARTLLGMEVHREFFSAPQRAALGATEEMFGLDESMSREEKVAAGWSLTMGRMNIVPFNEESSQVPAMHEYRASPPTGYIEMLRHLSLMVCSDAGMPPSYIGVHTDNPASADSIKALESRIERKTLARIRDRNVVLNQVARLMILARDGKVDEKALSKVKSRWAPPGTPTPSAAADATMKLVAAEVLPPDSPVTYRRIGLTDDEQQELAREKRQASLAGLSARLAESRVSPEAQRLAGRRTPSEPGAELVGEGPVSGSVATAEDAAALKVKFDALGVAIRAGVRPEDAARRLGLEGIEFTGAVPVSLRVPEEQVEDLEER